jgi:hypothetical protein
MAAASQLNVFVSSTCYDLIDLRAELARFLTENGCVARLSEDSSSAFSVDPTDDSIASCLANVEAADAVVCIIDRRYGGTLKSGTYAGRSATHAEIEHARALSPPKPVFFFVRQRSFLEYDHMRQNPGFKTSWVEKESPENRDKWFKMMEAVSRLPKHDNWSNWCDQFQSITDLKGIVLKRLSDRFPGQAVSLALRPDRVVRLAFRLLGSNENGTIRGYFFNVGVGPAVDLAHGIRDLHKFVRQCSDGGLGVNEHLVRETDGTYYDDRWTLSFPYWAYCSYSNVYGDRFRVEAELEHDKGSIAVYKGERFFVGRAGASEEELIQVIPA